MTGGKIILGLIIRVSGKSRGKELILINAIMINQGTTSMVLNISEEAITMNEGITILAETLIIITIFLMFTRTSTSMGMGAVSI